MKDCQRQARFDQIVEWQKKRDNDREKKKFFASASAAFLVLATIFSIALYNHGYYLVSTENGCNPSKIECYEPLPRFDFTTLGSLTKTWKVK